MNKNNKKRLTNREGFVIINSTTKTPNHNTTQTKFLVNKLKSYQEKRNPIEENSNIPKV